MKIFNLKRMIALILISVTLIVSVPISSSAAISTDTVTEIMNSLKENTYRQGWYWCGGNIDAGISYSACADPGCTCNNFNGAYQCQGFALYMAQRVTGSYPVARLSSYTHGLTSGTWTCYTNTSMGNQSFCAMKLKPGDIVRASYSSSYSSGHTAIVWKVENNKIYFAEAWGSVYCKINWGGFNYSAYTLDAICAEYPYVAAWRNSAVTLSANECTHTYVDGYEGNHPHRTYSRCTVCGKSEYTGGYKTVKGCVCCAGTHSYTVSYETEHPHYETKTCSLCKDHVQTTKTKTDYSCARCMGMPYNMTALPSVNTANVGDTVTVTYSADNAVSYNLSVNKDGVMAIESAVMDGINPYVFTPTAPGNYTFTLLAASDTGKTATVQSSVLTVKAPITELTKEGTVYTLKYDITLDEEKAALFCEERDLTLTEYTPELITASFDAGEELVEYIGEDSYTYIPAKLSYHEAEDFCRLSGAGFAYADSEEVNELMIRLCARAGADGILMGADDIAKEKLWTGSDGQALTYTNWNPSYTGAVSRYRNYLFMYPGGSWVDSVAMPIYTHGFVLKGYEPYVYTENEDGTLTLSALPVKSSPTFTVPETHDGKTVSALGAELFTDCVFDKVYIPDTVTYTDPTAFDGADIMNCYIPRGSVCEELLIKNSISYEIVMPFEDVKPGAWYYEGVYFCYTNFLTSGTSATKFSPSSTVTREMFVMMLANLMGADLTQYEGVSSFTDVKPGNWYSAAVEWAYQNGITSGVSEDRFGRGAPVTREQIAVFLLNISDKPKKTAVLVGFDDSDRVSSWALSGMQWAVDNKIINGTSATTLSPKNTAKRSELCLMLYNYCNNIKQ